VSKPNPKSNFINQRELAWLVGNPDYLAQQAQALSSHTKKDKVDITYLLEKVENINRVANNIKAHFASK
jgi:hypothetical protein